MAEQSSTSATPITQIRAELAAAGSWREVWYDADRQALMVGSWPYGRRIGDAGEDDRPVLTLIANAPTYLAALLDVAEAAQEWKESERAVEDVSTFGASDMTERLHRRRLATHGLFAALGKIPQVCPEEDQ